MSKQSDVSSLVPASETPNKCTTLRERWRHMQETNTGSVFQRKDALEAYRSEWNKTVWCREARLGVKKKSTKLQFLWRMPSNNYTFITNCLCLESLMIEVCWMLTCLASQDTKSAREAAINCKKLCEGWKNTNGITHYAHELEPSYYGDIAEIISAMQDKSYQAYEKAQHTAKTTRFSNIRIWGEAVCSMLFATLCNDNARRLAEAGCIEEALSLLNQRDDETERALRQTNFEKEPQPTRTCDFFLGLGRLFKRHNKDEEVDAWEDNLRKVAKNKNISPGVFSVSYLL